MTKRTFPNPLLAALFLVALLTTAAFSQVSITANYTDGVDELTSASSTVTGADAAEVFGKLPALLPTLTHKTNSLCSEAIGWVTANDGTNVAVTVSDIESGKTVYAKWSPIPAGCLTIDLKTVAATGTLGKTKLKTTNGVLGSELAAVEKKAVDVCNEFKRWNTATDGSGTDVDGSFNFSSNFPLVTEINAIWGAIAGCIKIEVKNYSDAKQTVPQFLPALGGKLTAAQIPTNLTHNTDACKIQDVNVTPGATGWVINGSTTPVSTVNTFTAAQDIDIKWITDPAATGCSSVKLTNANATGAVEDPLGALRATTAGSEKHLTTLPLTLNRKISDELNVDGELCDIFLGWSSDTDDQAKNAISTGKEVTRTTDVSAGTPITEIFAVWGTATGCFEATLAFNASDLATGVTVPKKKIKTGTDATLGAALPATLKNKDVCKEDVVWRNAGSPVDGTTTLSGTTPTPLTATWADIDGCHSITITDGKKAIGSRKLVSDPGVISTTPPQDPLPSNLTRACHTYNNIWKIVGGIDIPNIVTQSFSKNAEIEPKWVRTSGCKTVVFDANGGTFGGGDDILERELGADNRVAKADWPSNPTRTGAYSFKEWSLNGLVKTADSTYVFSLANDFAGGDEAKLYAVWRDTPAPIIKPATPASTFSIVVSGQNLQILGASKAMPVSIYNLKGKLVLNSTAMPNESISLAHLPKGVYIVRAGNKTAKFAR